MESVNMTGVAVVKYLSFSVLLIITSLVFLSGCLGEVPSGQVPGESANYPGDSESPGIFNETSGDFLSDNDRMDLRYAFMQLNLSVSDGYLTGDNYSVRIIRGINADIYGNCDSWIVGAVSDGKNVLLKYTLLGWQEEEWPGVLRGEEINTDEIIPSAELFEKNYDLITGITDNSEDPHMDIEITSGNYRIFINDRGNLTALKFDTMTGDVV
jgi:hypothetical protein